MLRALIAADLRAYPHSLISHVHRRLGEMYQMVRNGELGSTDGRTYRRYFSLP